MATLTSGDNISLQNMYSGSRLTGDLSSWDNYLGSFTPSTGLSLGFLQAWRNNIPGTADTTIISMSAAGIDSVTGISGYTYVVEGTSEEYGLTVNGAGWLAEDLWITYGRSGNSAVWVSDASNVFSQHFSSEAEARGSTNGAFDAIFANSVPNSDGVLDSVLSATVNGKYADYVNMHAPGYDTLFQKTIYWVDTYDGNATALCLTSDTPILLSDGSSIEIGELEEGMKLKGYSLDGFKSSEEMNILNWNSDSQLSPEEVEVEVVNIIFSFAEKVYNINNGTLKATAEHPFLVNDNGIRKFKVTHLLNVGDFLIKADGTEDEITSIEIENGTVEIVSLDVDGPDTYLANGYITHNKGMNSHTDFAGPSAPTGVTWNNTTGFLSWTAPANQTTNGVTAYDIHIDDVSNFSGVDLSYTDFSSTQVSLKGTSLPAGPAANYYVRVRAIESGLRGAWSTPIQFIFNPY